MTRQYIVDSFNYSFDNGRLSISGFSIAFQSTGLFSLGAKPH